MVWHVHSELEVYHKLPDEFFIAILKNILESQILLLEQHVDKLILETWLQLMEEHISFTCKMQDDGSNVVPELELEVCTHIVE